MPSSLWTPKSSIVSQLTVTECILISAPMSCELDPIPFKLIIEYLDWILNSLTDLFSSSLASDIFHQCFKSALVTPIPDLCTHLCVNLTQYTHCIYIYIYIYIYIAAYLTSLLQKYIFCAIVHDIIKFYMQLDTSI